MGLDAEFKIPESNNVDNSVDTVDNIDALNNLDKHSKKNLDKLLGRK